ncbi:MAG: peroxiredoxin [Chloroflexi bacterium]|nr:peroxiredoxin [Chloroflexota bacterium]
MPVRTSEATWNGSLREGSGTMKLGSGAFEGSFSYLTRFEEEPGTNPEELLGAAHAGCFSMSLSSRLGGAGFTPKSIHTIAKVHFGKIDGKSRIPKIELECEADVPGISNEQFQELAEVAKSGCPVSYALGNVEITLSARLI